MCNWDLGAGRRTQIYTGLLASGTLSFYYHIIFRTKLLVLALDSKVTVIAHFSQAMCKQGRKCQAVNMLERPSLGQTWCHGKRHQRSAFEPSSALGKS